MSVFISYSKILFSFETESLQEEIKLMSDTRLRRYRFEMKTGTRYINEPLQLFTV